LVGILDQSGSGAVWFRLGWRAGHGRVVKVPFGGLCGQSRSVSFDNFPGGGSGRPGTVASVPSSVPTSLTVTGPPRGLRLARSPFFGPRPYDVGPAGGWSPCTRWSGPRRRRHPDAAGGGPGSRSQVPLADWRRKRSQAVFQGRCRSAGSRRCALVVSVCLGALCGPAVRVGRCCCGRFRKAFSGPACL
jgi:hypothetical protein